MKALHSMILTTVLTACTPMTEAQREAHEYDRIEFRQQFVEDRKRCNASGRSILIQAYGGAVDRDGIPRSRVYYVCA